MVDWECIHYGKEPIYNSTYECKIEHPDLGLLIWQCGYASLDPDIGEHILVNDFKEFDIIQYDDRDEPKDLV